MESHKRIISPIYTISCSGTGYIVYKLMQDIIIMLKTHIITVFLLVGYLLSGTFFYGAIKKIKSDNQSQIVHVQRLRRRNYLSEKKRKNFR